MRFRIGPGGSALLIVAVACAGGGNQNGSANPVNTSKTAIIRYGTAAQQFAELRLPKRGGPFPVVVLLHGGCWIGYAGLEDMANLSIALAREGYATWNVEYRRGHEPGGGWPGTFEDAEHGVSALQGIATKYPLDLSHVVLVGHSAGGQLALYVGSRLKRPVVSLAGIVDMRAYADRSRNRCVEGELKVMGGSPAQFPDRYAKVSPAQLLPLGIRQILIWGERDNIVPESLFTDYEGRADQVEIVRVPSAGHFEFSAAEGPAWEATLAAVSRLIKVRAAKPDR